MGQKSGNLTSSKQDQIFPYSYDYNQLVPGFLDAELNQHVVLAFLFSPIRHVSIFFWPAVLLSSGKGLVFSATKSGRQINDLLGVAFRWGGQI